MKADCGNKVNHEGKKGYFRKISDNSTNTQDSDSQKPRSTHDHSRQRGGNRKRNGPKYKTELCKNYSEKGYCPYRWKCQFAHGSQELQGDDGLSTNRKWKTKRCRSFWEEGICPYGVRCQFDHYEEVSEETRNYLEIWKMVLTCQGRNKQSMLFGKKGQFRENSLHFS